MIVFAIGLPKTGTHSLVKACEILGLTTYRQCTSNKRKCRINLDTSNQSLSEWSLYYHSNITHLYPDLYIDFPTSKFILTIRHPSAFKESALRFWQNRSTSIFGLLFGIGNIEENIEILMKAYIGYINKAIYFFRRNPSRLLILKLEDPNKWDKLCTFLDRPIPKEKYPHLMKYDEKLKGAQHDRIVYPRGG